MSSKRTKLSNWVYRITLGLMIVGTIRFWQLMQAQMETMLADRSDAIYWTALASSLSAPLSLGIATLALFLRSGAVVWLLGLQFGLMALSLAPSMLAYPDTASFAVLFAIAVLVITAIGAALFTYLIRREEIRRP